MKEYKKYLRYVPALAVALVLLLAGLILYFIIRYGVDVPYLDQWEYVGFFDHLSVGKLTFEELFRLHGEYRQFFPNIIFVFLGWLTNWNVRYEMLVSFLLACLISFNIYRLATLTIIGERRQKWLMFFLANLFIFSPMQYENWLFGVQIEYFLPIACITTGLVIAFTGIDSRLKLIFCILLAVISTFSSANGFLCWIVLYPAYYFSGASNNFFRKWHIVFTWGLATGIALFFYFNGYRKPVDTPGTSIAWNHPLDAIYYFMGILGNTLRVIHSLDIIIVVGGVLITVFLAQVLYIIWHIQDKQMMRASVAWLMLGLYSILTAAMIMVGRLGFGLYQSLASRYTTFTLYLDVAIIFLAAIIIHHHARDGRISYIQKAGIAVLVAFLIFTKINTYPVAVSELKHFHSTIQHAKAGLLFINYFPHELCYNKIYPSDFNELKRKAKILNSLRYLRPGLIKSNILQDFEGSGSGKTDYGAFFSVIHLTGNYYLAIGYAIMPDTKSPADAIILSYENEQGKSQFLTLNNFDAVQWKMLFTVDLLPCYPVVIHAWAFDASTGKAYRLKGSHSIIMSKT